MSDTIFFQILESGSLVDLHTKFGGSNSKRRKKCHWGGTSVADGFGQTVRLCIYNIYIYDMHGCAICRCYCENYITICNKATARPY